MSLLEEVCHLACAFENSKVHTKPSVSLSGAVNQDAKLSATAPVHACLFPTVMIMD